MRRKAFPRCILNIALLTAILLLYGCASTSSTQPALDVPPVANSIASHKDIVLPADLKYNSSKSMTINTDSFTGGIYHYSGRLELNSLKDFIKASMAKNKWKLVGESSADEAMLAFMKPNKTCLVTLSEGFGGFLGTTYIELYVTGDLAAAKGLNPFGEPVN